jgi:hypothetical protein
MVSLCEPIATLRVARIALVTRCRRPRSETKSVSPRSSSDQRNAISGTRSEDLRFVGRSVP